MDLDLYVYDESIDSPFLSRRFKDEIIFELFYLKFEEFLSKEEIKIVSPNTYGEITIGEKKPFEEKDKLKFLTKIAKVVKGKGGFGSIDRMFDDYLITSEKVEDRERDPEELKNVLKKIQIQLIDKSSEFPLIHSVFKTKELKEEIGYVMIDNVKGHIEGDLYHYDDYKRIRNCLLYTSDAADEV